MHRKIRNTLLIFCLLIPTWSWAGFRISFEELKEDYQRYIGQTITLTTPMVVTGVYYDSLILAPKRLYVPEESANKLAEGDSTSLIELKRLNIANSIRLSARIFPYKITTGAIITHLTAKVNGPRSLVTGTTPKFRHNRSDISRLRPQQGELLICAANIQNYFADLGGYAGAKTPEQFQKQTEKVARGLRYLDADIYALCEMERGNKSPQALCNRLNQLAHRDIYTYLNNDGGNGDGDTISVCFIYRKDKVAPYGPTLYAYPDTLNIYHHRFKTIAWESLSSHERFVMSLNHPRSKRGESKRSDSLRMDNIFHITHTLDSILEYQIYQDSDILMVGDYNCYTQEHPIQYILAQGYQDMLIPSEAKYSTPPYTYVYKGESGCLDRVFASPSMAKQVTGVKVVHLNADYFYSLGYRSKYSKAKSIIRYSDHDPILITIRLKQ